jgi:hypothetical protein
MADSPLPLVTWFAAIWFVASNPAITTLDLQRQLRLSRTATVRAMAAKIRATLTADGRTALLAGLDRYLTSPESSVASPDFPEIQRQLPQLIGRRTEIAFDK